MKELHLRLIIFIMCATIPTQIFAESKTYAIIAKSKTDNNFIIVYEAAKKEAEKHGNKILFLGSEKKAHFRTQDKAVKEAIIQNVDGIAISVLNEEFLITNSFKELTTQNIPVVTYDSDFSAKYKKYRQAYIGTNNEDFGYQMGLVAQKLHPQDATIAIISGLPEATNINKRITGVRRAISADTSFSNRLSGEAGWIEHSRTPWYCRDDYNIALSQLIFSLEDDYINVIISVGWWPQQAKEYRKKIFPYKEKYLNTKKKIIICADATPHQLEYLEEGLSHANISQDFEEMGRLCYLYLKQINDGEKIKEYTYTPVKVYLKEDFFNQNQ